MLVAEAGSVPGLHILTFDGWSIENVQMYKLGTILAPFTVAAVHRTLLFVGIKDLQCGE